MDEQNSVFQQFETILKETVTPRMKALRFKKAASTFLRPLPEFSQILNVQKSQWNHKDSVQFAMNIGFYSDLIHQQIFNFPQPKNPKEYDCFLRFRSGSITNQGDEWYELGSTKKWSQCADAVAFDLDEYILPLLVRLTNFDFLADFWINNAWLQKQTPVLSRFLILQKLGFTERALSEFGSLYNQALFPKDSIITINHADGRSETKTSKGKRSQEFIEHVERFARLNGIDLSRLELQNE